MSDPTIMVRVNVLQGQCAQYRQRVAEARRLVSELQHDLAILENAKSDLRYDLMERSYSAEQRLGILATDQDRSAIRVRFSEVYQQAFGPNGDALDTVRPVHAPDLFTLDNMIAGRQSVLVGNRQMNLYA